MFRMISFAAALALVPGVAQAQDWRLASQGSTTGSTFFLDKDSITTTSGRARGTVFMVLAAPQQGVSGIKAEFEYECGTGKRRTIFLQAFDEAKQPGERFDGRPDWEDTPPESQFGSVWKLMCGQTALPTTSYGAAAPYAAAISLKQ